MTDAAPAKPADLPAGPLFCSFCMKSQDLVAQLVAGPGGIFICNECVALCNEYIAGRTPSLPIAPELTNAQLLAQLPPLEATVRGKGNQLQWVVDQLRAREVSWADIGQALGVSRQAAWERFS